MFTLEQKQFLDKAAAAATAANHPFPRMAACEAAEESRWGKSGLAVEDNNLFGMKQHRHPLYGTVNIPTREFIGIDAESKLPPEKRDEKLDGWISTVASWVKYPDWAACFNDRLNTLVSLSHAYPHYAAALQATNAETYVREVSQTWSSDPQRADKIIAIYRDYVSM